MSSGSSSSSGGGGSIAHVFVAGDGVAIRGGGGGRRNISADVGYRKSSGSGGGGISRHGSITGMVCACDGTCSCVAQRIGGEGGNGVQGGRSEKRHAQTVIDRAEEAAVKAAAHGIWVHVGGGGTGVECACYAVTN